MPSITQDDQVMAAHLTIAILRSILPVPTSITRYRVLPNEETSLEQATQQLAGMPKPLVCGGLIDGEELQIRCHEAASSSRELQSLSPGTGMLQDTLSEMRLEADKILFSESDRPLVLSKPALRYWIDNFDIGMDYDVGSFLPPEEQHRQGIVRVLRFGPPAISTTSVDDLDLPEPLREIIGKEHRRAVDRFRPREES